MTHICRNRLQKKEYPVKLPTSNKGKVQDTQSMSQRKNGTCVRWNGISIK